MEAVVEDVSHDEAIKVAEQMQRFGGSFAQNLGKALACADSENRAKIKAAWPILWERYSESH